ncbi:hypothetical protein I5E68_09870 [Novosphingobium sp. YJ-S2-02]|uniref:Uncharacterized protein n=1 Tax=Novosphingobium aureum TaxID=2792964 RepID=A0A931HCG0_9SPHN|nr:hypothetical protein [Novosphingobium aureum]MBH0113252.1 hypothetical protein [Novosphingobium aureum]
MKITVIEDWRQAWRWSSVHLAAGYGMLQSWAAIDPDGYRLALAMLPDPVRRYCGIGLALLAIATRVTEVTAKGVTGDE